MGAFCCAPGLESSSVSPFTCYLGPLSTIAASGEYCPQSEKSFCAILDQWRLYRRKKKSMQSRPNPKEVDVHAIADGCTLIREHYLRCVALQVTIPTYLLDALLVRSRGAGVMAMETHRYVIERRCFMTACGLLGVLPLKPFYVYTENLKAESMKLPKIMNVTSASNASSCNIRAHKHEARITEREGQALRQCYSTN